MHGVTIIQSALWRDPEPIDLSCPCVKHNLTFHPSNWRALMGISDSTASTLWNSTAVCVRLWNFISLEVGR